MEANLKHPPGAVAQSSDCEFLKMWWPEDHKVVLAEFAISGLQCLSWAIVLECSFSGWKLSLVWSVKIKIFNSPLQKSWPSTTECDGRFSTSRSSRTANSSNSCTLSAWNWRTS